MRRRGLFEGSILDPAIDAAPAPCPPVERLRHPTHWAAYRPAAQAAPDIPTVVIRTEPDVPARSVVGATPGLLAGRSATQVFQGMTAAVLATLGASTAFYWQKAHTAPSSHLIALAALPSPPAPAMLATPIVPKPNAATQGTVARAAEPAAAALPATPPDALATIAPPASVVPEAPKPEPAAVQGPPPPTAAVSSPPPPSAPVAEPPAPGALALAKPVVQARVLRTTFAAPALLPAEPGAVRIAPRAHASPPHPTRAAAASPRPETHLAAARPSLPHWLTDQRKTPLIMSEPPHDLTPPPGAVAAEAVPPQPPQAQDSPVQASPPQALPPLRSVPRPANSLGQQRARWYGGPVYPPNGWYPPYGGYRPYGGYGYGGPPGPYGAPAAPPTDVTID